MENQVI